MRLLILLLFPLWAYGASTIIAGTNSSGNPQEYTNTDGQLPITKLAGEYNTFNQNNKIFSTAEGPWEWEVIAASDTDEPCGGTGAAGDYLAELIILPAVAAAGAVSIEDGTGTNYPIHPGGGTTALVSLHPIVVPLGLTSVSGAWEITTGANVTVICKGYFTD